MKKITVFVAGIIASESILLSNNAASNPQKEISEDVSEQIILRLMNQSITTTVDDYYGEHRQYWQQNLLSFQKKPQSPYYGVTLQVETFYGAHNPPYGIETMVFHIGIFGEIQLASFDHQDEL